MGYYQILLLMYTTGNACPIYAKITKYPLDCHCKLCISMKYSLSLGRYVVYCIFKVKPIFQSHHTVSNILVDKGVMT